MEDMTNMFAYFLVGHGEGGGGGSWIWTEKNRGSGTEVSQWYPKAKPRQGVCRRDEVF